MVGAPPLYFPAVTFSAVPTTGEAGEMAGAAVLLRVQEAAFAWPDMVAKPAADKSEATRKLFLIWFPSIIAVSLSSLDLASISASVLAKGYQYVLHRCGHAICVFVEFGPFFIGHRGLIRHLPQF